MLLQKFYKISEKGTLTQCFRKKRRKNVTRGVYAFVNVNGSLTIKQGKNLKGVGKLEIYNNVHKMFHAR